MDRLLGGLGDVARASHFGLRVCGGERLCDGANSRSYVRVTVLYVEVSDEVYSERLRFIFRFRELMRVSE